MALNDFFNWLLGKKPKNTVHTAEIPLSQVENMINKGMSKQQVVEFLRGHGYTLAQIQKAISQVEAKQGAVSGAPVGPPELPPLTPKEPKPVQPAEAPSLAPVIPEVATPSEGVDTEIGKVDEIEELIEAIVEEKFAEIIDRLDEVDNLKEDFSNRLDKASSEFEDIKNKLKDLENKQLDITRDYKKTLEEIRLEMSAIERVLHKLVPDISAKIKKSKENIEEKEEE